MASDRNEVTKPILPGTAASDYERYLRTDELLALQKRPEEMLHPDELTFQVVHQSSELLMKGAAWEMTRARDYIEAGEYADDPVEPLDAIDDQRLRLIFTCCHPALGMDARIALTLRASIPRAG